MLSGLCNNYQEGVEGEAENKKDVNSSLKEGGWHEKEGELSNFLWASWPKDTNITYVSQQWYSLIFFLRPA